MNTQKEIQEIFADYKMYIAGKGCSREALLEKHNNHPLLLSMLASPENMIEGGLEDAVSEMSDIYLKYSGRKLRDEEWEAILEAANNISVKVDDNKWCRDTLVELLDVLEDGEKEPDTLEESQLSLPYVNYEEQKWDIQTEMHLARQGNVLAYGTVTIDNCIKFPVQLRKYKDEKSGEEKSFLSYPRRLVKGQWEDTVHPERELHKKITASAGNAIKKELAKDMYLPEVDVVSVTPVTPKNIAGAKAVICGLATVKISGLTIHGITIKQSEKGLFINMPQYQNDTGYKDIVYGTSKAIQQKMEEAILSVYKDKIKTTTPLKTANKVL